MAHARRSAMRGPALAALTLLGLAAGPVSAGEPGGRSGAHSGHGGAAQSAHATAHAAVPSGFHRAPLPGHGWHGVVPGPWGAYPAWSVYPPGWAFGLYGGYYAPWWWDEPLEILTLPPAASEVPESTPPPVSYRFYCPVSSAYYPDVASCAVPWLRVVDER